MSKNQFPAISRQNRLKAIEEGKLTYESGSTCKNCGTNEKYVKNSSCVNCVKQKTLNRSPDVYKKYTQSEKGKEWLGEYRKSKVYREVQNKYVRKNYENNKSWYVNHNLKQKYGLTLENYNIMLEAQNKACFICLKPSVRKMLSVDHNHETGTIRKLLCNNCNTALGLLKEDTNIMQKMIDYVKEHQ